MDSVDLNLDSRVDVAPQEGVQDVAADEDQGICADDVSENYLHANADSVG